MAAGIGQVFEGMIMEKNFSLLRPFDLEAAKRGEAIVWGHETKCRFVGVSDHEKTARNIVEHESGLSYVCDRELAMAPLAWVEGKPVYKGDVLWQNLVKRVVLGASQSGSYIETDTAIIAPQYLTWTPPKIKREGWVNIYPNGTRDTKEDADRCAKDNRIACVRIEWEE